MDFVTLDFETATSKRDSPCEIGLTFVKDSRIIETKSWLINPRCEEFDSFNTILHGISKVHVQNSPSFDVVWEEIFPLLVDQHVIAHNASFDMSVLRWTLSSYDIAHPNMKYLCSYVFSKGAWPGLPSYDLKSLCRHHSIELKHHSAASDSLATAHLALKAFDAHEISSFKEIRKKLKTSIGEIYPDWYRPSGRVGSLADWGESSSSQKTKPSEYIGNSEKVNPESIFYGATVVFTGVMSSMSRNDAHQTIADIGGIVGGSVTKKTNYLVVGFQDFRLVGDDGMSSKQEKAIKMIAEGSELEILSEQDFLQNI